MQSADIPLHICSEETSSERRVSPSWTIAHFKTRLEPITGIPSSSQRLVLRLGGSLPSATIEAADEEATKLCTFPLQPYAEIYVSSVVPVSDGSENFPFSFLMYNNGNFGSLSTCLGETVSASA